MRNEIKFKGSYEQLRKIINSQSAQRTFPNRTINSLYFDTASLNDYHDSEEGTVPRKKIRVRWYGASRFEGVATGTLETKKPYPTIVKKLRFPLRELHRKKY